MMAVIKHPEKTRETSKKLWELSSFAFVSKEKYNPASGVDLPCVELEHIEKETGILSGHTQSLLQASIKNKFQSGDILFGKLRPNLRKFVQPNFDGVCSTEIWVLKTDPQKCAKDFLFYLVQSEKFIQSACKTTGSKMPRADWGVLSEEPFHLPCLAEQHKIAAILRTWDDAIEKVSLLVKKQKQEKHIFQAKIFSGMLIPKNHKKKNTSLYDLADWHNGLAFKNIDFSETGRPVLKIAELKAGVTSTTAFTNGRYAESVLVKQGDLLFSWSGNPDTSIDAFIWDGPEGWLNQHIFRVVPKPYVQKEYLYQFLRHIKNRLAYIATGKQSTGLGHVTKADMKRTYLVLPDMDDQIKISGLLNNFDVLISGLERQKKIFQSQKRGLMQKLLTGQWRVKISEQEAA